MPAIFISHSNLDHKAADDVKTVLAGLGFDRVFLDFDKVTGIGAGENWEKRLYEELTRCHAVVLILTPNWLASKWCFAEMQQARALGKVILPIVFGPLGDSYVLPDIQAIDLIDWKQEGLARLEQRLNAITNELARGFRLEPGRPPYPGIHAFEADDAAIYFGRDDETRAVIEKLDARRTQGGVRFLLVMGASGAGKSSLLKAGVLPQLARRRSHWLLLPVMRPEKAPLEAFAKILAEQLGQPDDWRATYDALSGPDAAGRIERIVQDLRVGESRAATILIPIDQFEELFTVAEPGERASLLSLLAAILDPARGLPLVIVATGRADVLQGLLETSSLAPLMDTTSLLPMPLDRVPLLVEGPAAVASLIVEKGLPERIKRDVENPEALPLLAYTLRMLNDRSPDKRLTLAAYLTLGDGSLTPVQNAVRLGADEAITRLKPTNQEMAALRDSFIPHLVRLRLDDRRYVRQPAPLTALPREAERLIHALVEARLLTSRTSDKTVPVVEVVHEALFTAWPTLTGWLAEEQNFLADIERLKGAQETWTQAAEAQKPQALLHGLLLSRARDWLIRYPQRFTNPSMEPLRAFIADSAAADDAERSRSQKLRQMIFQGLVAAVLIFACIAGIAGWFYFQANKERHEVEAQRNQAQLNFQIAKQAANDMVFKLAQGLRNVAGMRVESVRKILDGAQALMDQLARAAPDDLDLQRSRFAALSEFVDTYLAIGDLGHARTAAEEGLAIMRHLAVTNPGNAGWQRDVSVGLNNVGGVRRAAGDRAGALAVYEEALAITRKLAAADPGNARWQSDLSIDLDNVGDVKYDAGDRDGALAVYEEALAIARKLAAADPGNAEWQRDASVILERVGVVRRDAGDRDGALAVYEESLAIRRKLAAGDLENAGWQRDVSFSLEWVGDVRRDAGDRDGALAVYEEALAIARKLAAADPGNAEWQRDVSVSLEKVGDVRRDAGDRNGTLAVYEESLAIRRKLAAGDLENAGWQRAVSFSLNKVGDVRRDAGDRDGALAVYEESLAIRRKLAAADPGNASWQSEVSFSLNNVGDVRRDAGDRDGALAVYEEGLAIRRNLAAADPGNAGWQSDVGVSLNNVGNVRRDFDDRAGALAYYEEGLAIRRKLATADPGNAGWQIDLYLSLYNVGTMSDPAAARKFLTEALSIAETLAREDKLPANRTVWPQELRDALANLPPDHSKAQ
jgi:tetratricopeptide (TPR) repeat protein